MAHETYDAFALGSRASSWGLQIAVPARGELSLSSKAGGQVTGSNHSEVAQVWSYSAIGLAFSSLLEAA